MKTSFGIAGPLWGESTGNQWFPHKGLVMQSFVVIFVVNLTSRHTTSWVCGNSWWRHLMETFSAFLALCVGNSLVTGEFPSQRPLTGSVDFFFELHLSKRLTKQSKHHQFEMSLHSLWHHCNLRYLTTRDVTVCFVFSHIKSPVVDVFTLILQGCFTGIRKI